MVAIILLLFALSVHAQSCDWRWVIEKTCIINDTLKNSTVYKTDSTEKITQKICKTNPPSRIKFDRVVAAARLLAKGNQSIKAFAIAMRQSGWNECDKLYHIAWGPGIIHSFKGDILTSGGETLATVISDGDPIRWEGWNINVVPIKDMWVERNIWINSVTGEEKILDWLNVTFIKEV